MVAYKKLTKEEKRTVLVKMTDKYYQNSEAKKLVDALEKDYVYEMTKYIPAEAYEFAKKYPMTVKKTSYDLYLKVFEGENWWNANNIFRWPYLHSGEVIVGFFADNAEFNDLNQSWSCEYKKIKKYIEVQNKELYDKIKNELVPKLKEIDEFANSLKCVISKITTLNKLKEELPEAYDEYIAFYGDPTPCNKTSNGVKSSFCDNVEKLRATYNNTTKKN